MVKLRYVTESTAVLIFTPVNRRYLTGFPSSLGFLLITKNENILFVDSRYFEAAEDKAKDVKVVLLKNIYQQLNETLRKENIKKLYIETENEISLYNALKSKLEVKVVPSDSLSERLLDLRSVKTKTELDNIVTAQRIAEKAFDEILNFIKKGVTEKLEKIGNVFMGALGLKAAAQNIAGAFSAFTAPAAELENVATSLGVVMGNAAAAERLTSA